MTPLRFISVVLLFVAVTAHAQEGRWWERNQEEPWWEKLPLSEERWWTTPAPKLPSKSSVKSANGWEDIPEAEICPAKFLASCIKNYNVAREKQAADWVNYYGTLIQRRFDEAIARARRVGDTKAMAEMIMEQRKYPPEPDRVIGRLREDMEKNYTEIVSSWDGSNVMELIKSWGPPRSEYKAPDGSQILTYEKESLSDLNGSLTQFKCETFFTVKAQKIVDWRWRGNGCFANPR